MISLRKRWAALDALLLIACAAYWFGNSGFGLALLWVSGSGWLSRSAVAVGGDGHGCAADFAGYTPVWLSEQRLCLKDRGGGSLEIYRDEVSAACWSALKRQAVSGQQDGQLATGRNTSI